MFSLKFRILLVFLLGVLFLFGCQSQEEAIKITPKGGANMEITSSVFKEQQSIPSKYTCDGADVSPPLSINGVPDSAETLALVADDPDAPGGTFVHWGIWNLPASTGKIPAKVPQEKSVASLGSAVQGKNDFGEYGYRGPCPPGGEHRYQFHLYAVDRKIDLSAGASKNDLLKAIKGSVVAETELTGLYSR